MLDVVCVCGDARLPIYPPSPLCISSQHVAKSTVHVFGNIACVVLPNRNMRRSCKDRSPEEPKGDSKFDAW